MAKKPRIRKAPTVRQQIEVAAKQTAAKKTTPKRSVSKSTSSFSGSQLRSLGLIFRPLAPIGRVIIKVLGWLVPRYFINAWRELRQVSWPNRRESWRLTGAVFIFAVVFGALVAGVDKGLDELFKKVILK